MQSATTLGVDDQLVKERIAFSLGSLATSVMAFGRG